MRLFAVVDRYFSLLFFLASARYTKVSAENGVSPAVISGNNSENSKRELGEAGADRVNSD
jgi:hypothetical protein